MAYSFLFRGRRLDNENNFITCIFATCFRIIISSVHSIFGAGIQVQLSLCNCLICPLNTLLLLGDYIQSEQGCTIDNLK